MNTTTFESLEFNKIKSILSNFAVTFLGKKRVEDLLPSNNINDIEIMQQETSEAVLLIIKKGQIPLFEINDITISLKKLASGSTLGIKEILDIGLFLKLCRELKNYFFKNYSDVDISFANNIGGYFSIVYVNKDVEDSIFKIILDENTISDNASSNLYSIRRKQRDLELKIRDKLQGIISSTKYSKFLQDCIITIRNERFVVPVKQESRQEISGFIHDISSSGSTVFIEPTSVFEMNNSIKELKFEEELEIERILSILSGKIANFVSELVQNLNLISEIDFIFSKAKYSLSLNGIKPLLNVNGYINLLQARHPLIDKNKVVPINVSIGKNYSSLIITGPNTGGKTVALKTVRTFNFDDM